MGLKEGVEAVVTEMEHEAKTRHGEAQSVLQKYSHWLRTLLIVGGDAKPVERQWTPEEQHAIMVAAARREFREKRRISGSIDQGLEEVRVSEGDRSVEIVGGRKEMTSSMPTFAVIDAAMPVGAKTLVDGDVYILNQDGKLHFSQKDSDVLNKQCSR